MEKSRLSNDHLDKVLYYVCVSIQQMADLKAKGGEQII